MEFRKVLALRGPNIWARFPVLEAWVDLGPLNEHASNELPGFNERLMGWLPTLVEHTCSLGAHGGFFERLRRGTYMAHILEHVALELQCLAGTHVSYGKTRQSSEPNVYRVAVRYREEELGRACLEKAREMCMAAVEDRPWNTEAELQQLKELAKTVLPTEEVASILAAAKRRGIPARRLGVGNFVQLGWGTQQRRLDGAATDRTGTIAVGISDDAGITRTFLESVGAPLAEQGSEVALPTWQLLVIGDRVVSAVRTSGAGDGARDQTESLHAEVAGRAVDACAAIGLDVAAVNVAANNLAQPLEAQGGVILNVKARPSLTPHTAQPVADALLDHLYPNGANGRIPVVGVTGVNGKTTTTRLIAHLAGETWPQVGMSCTEGVYVGGRRVISGDCSGPASARAVLDHPHVGAAVLETVRGGILRAGLGFDRCDVAVLTNIGEGDHLGIADVHTTEQLAWIKSTLVAAVAANGMAVLNAADPLAAATAEHCEGSITYFAQDGNLPLLKEHAAEGGRTIFVRNDRVILAEGTQEKELISLHSVPLTHGGRVGFHVENVLAAVAAAWALKVPEEQIRSGLQTFVGGLGQVPARFNLLGIRGATVILDYGHNLSALKRQVESLEQFPHARRTIVYSAAGDRRDADMIKQGELLGNAFERVVLYEDAYMRGRADGEIIGLFRKGLSNGKRVKEIVEVRGGLKAVEDEIARLRFGDLLVVQPDVIDDAVEYLQRLLASDIGAREIDFDEAIAAPTMIADHFVTVGLPAIEVRTGRLGKSVHAMEPLEKGRLILRGWGPSTGGHRTRWSIQVDTDSHIIPFAPLLFLNHSCAPNCGLLIRRGVEEMELHALRPIEIGEELTMDYATFEARINYMNGQCLCHAPTCRAAITGYEEMPAELREYYGPYIAEYLRTGSK